jgi:hypothetical protein
MAAVQALTADGLFIGQSNEFFQLLQDLASEADAAQRGFLTLDARATEGPPTRGTTAATPWAGHVSSRERLSGPDQLRQREPRERQNLCEQVLRNRDLGYQDRSRPSMLGGRPRRSEHE